MATGKLISNGSTPFEMAASNGLHVAITGSFGGGTIAVEQIVNGVTVPLLDAGAAITFTAADDSDYLLKSGDRIRLTLTGATSPAINWSMS